MKLLSCAEIDREITSCTTETTAMATTLVELDSHPGLGHVRIYPPTGVTAQRWAAVEKILAQLWEDLGSVTSILESAKSVRQRRLQPGDDECAELTRLLRGPADLLARMRTGYPVVIEFLDTVDTVNSVVAARLAPSLRRLDAGGLAGPKEVSDLLALSATDPLSLTAGDIEERARAVEDSIERQSVELAELAVVQGNWSEAVVAAGVQLDLLHDAASRVARIRSRAEHMIRSGPLPVRDDAEPGLRAELQSMTSPDPAALLALRRTIEVALRVVGADEQLVQGLLDRHSELSGRLTAYQAKAARLGLGEDRDLYACGRIAAGLLSRRPCDLTVVTRAVADYQQLLAEKQGAPT
jgi:hypothetical protein